MESNFRRSFLVFNRWLLAVLLVVFVIIYLRYVLGSVPVCKLVAQTGKPCALCGCTRDFVAMLHGQAPSHNPLSGYLFVFLMSELVWRGAGSLLRFSRRVFWCDLVIHVLILGALTVHSVRVTLRAFD